MSYIPAEDFPHVDAPPHGRKFREALSRLTSVAEALPAHIRTWIEGLPEGDLPEAPSYGEDSEAGHAWVRTVQAYDRVRYSVPETVKEALQRLLELPEAPEGAGGPGEAGAAPTPSEAPSVAPEPSEAPLEAISVVDPALAPHEVPAGAEAAPAAKPAKKRK